MKELITIIFRNVVKLSINKYSCNIVIKIFESFEKLRGRAINELFHNAKLCTVAKNKYGILVLETFIKYLSPADRLNLRFIVVKRFNQDDRTQKDLDNLKVVLDLLK